MCCVNECRIVSSPRKPECILHSYRCFLVAIWHLYSCLVLFYCCFFPTHITPPYCFHSNAIAEMTVISCCYSSWLSSVHIWRLSSSQECCSLQQIANCGAGGVGVEAYYEVQVGGQPCYVTHEGTKLLQKKSCALQVWCQEFLLFSS